MQTSTSQLPQISTISVESTEGQVGEVSNENIPSSNRDLEEKSPIRLFIWFGVAALILFLLGGDIWLLFRYKAKLENAQFSAELNSSPSSLKIAGVVSYLQGDVYSIKSGRKIEVKLEDAVREGELIETEKGARAVITLDDGSVLRLNENTIIVLSSLSPNRIRVDNQAGSLYSRVQKDQNNQFYVQAGSVLVSSMGTAFTVDNLEDKGVKVAVFENKVKVAYKEEEALIEKGLKWSDQETSAKEISSEEIENDEFVKWNFEKDKLKKEEIVKKEVKQKEKPSPKAVLKPKPIETVKKPSSPVTTGVIKLEATVQTDGIRLKWRLNGLEAPKGFKIVKSRETDPVYPNDTTVYQPASSREYVWKITNGKTYHFRVCKFENGGCNIYSNNAVVAAPNISKSTVDTSGKKLTSISVGVQNLGGGQAKVSWSTNGGNPGGFKVVWSHNQAPVYPPRSEDGAKWVSGTTREYVINGLSGNYYFRVCEYSGGCQLYSNQVSANF